MHTSPLLSLLSSRSYFSLSSSDRSFIMFLLSHFCISNQTILYKEWWRVLGKCSVLTVITKAMVVFAMFLLLHLCHVSDGMSCWRKCSLWPCSCSPISMLLGLAHTRRVANSYFSQKKHHTHRVHFAISTFRCVRFRPLFTRRLWQGVILVLLSQFCVTSLSPSL